MLIDEEERFWSQAVNLLILPFGIFDEWFIEEIKIIYKEYEDDGLSIYLILEGDYEEEIRELCEKKFDEKEHSRLYFFIRKLSCRDLDDLDNKIEELIQKINNHHTKTLLVDLSHKSSLSSFLIHNIAKKYFERDFSLILYDPQKNFPYKKYVKTETCKTIGALMNLMENFSFHSALSLIQENTQFAQLAEIISIFRYWDDFEYEKVPEEIPPDVFILGEISGKFGKVYDKWYDCLLSLINVAKRIKRCCEVLDSLYSNRRQFLDEKFLKKKFDLEGLLLLSMDCLENAKRRAVERKFSDSILRCYRALEILTQALVIKFLNANPFSYYLNSISEEKDSRKLGLNDCLEELKNGKDIKICREVKNTEKGEEVEVYLIKSDGEEEILAKKHWIQNVMQWRNRCRLEHGYGSADEDKCIGAIAIVERFIERVIEFLREKNCLKNDFSDLRWQIKMESSKLDYLERKIENVKEDLDEKIRKLNRKSIS